MLVGFKNEKKKKKKKRKKEKKEVDVSFGIKNHGKNWPLSLLKKQSSILPYFPN